jgi:hypothetical protein
VLGVAATVTDDGAEVVWTAGTGARHAFRVCASTNAPDADQLAPFSVPPDGPGIAPVPPSDDFGAIVDGAGRERAPITKPGPAGSRRKGDEPPSPEDSSGVVLGRVVHRMFQAGLRGDFPADDLAAAARDLVTAEEAWTVADLQLLAAHAARTFAGIWSQPALRALLDGAECHYEVPLSVLPAPAKDGGRPQVLRGVMDCLACRPDGTIVVVDFKTGSRREADRRQLRAYVDAVRSMHPGSGVEGCLVYPEDAS